MDNIEAAVEITSSGIQTCQELITFYDGWKSYSNNILPTTYTINQLRETLIASKAFLHDVSIDQKKRWQTADEVGRCEDDLRALHKKLCRLKVYGKLRDAIQQAGLQSQGTWHPLQSSTLLKLMVFIQDIQARLQPISNVLRPGAANLAQQKLSQSRRKVDILAWETENHSDSEEHDWEKDSHGDVSKIDLNCIDLVLWTRYVESRAAERSELNEGNEERAENDAWDTWYAELAVAMAKEESVKHMMVAQPRIRGKLIFEFGRTTDVP